MTKDHIYSVSDLVGEMRQLMERSYPEIWIEAELSSLSTPASGHLYFSLKDEASQLRCAMFRNRAQISRYKPRSGDLVRVRAKISVYSARGDLQCIVQHIEDAGEGLLQRRFEELKAKLDQAGLFANQSKQSVPSHPQKIGIITSPSGAAVKDILTTLERRSPQIKVVIYPAVVQGDGAAKTLCDALTAAQQHAQCEVLVVSRGGGSMEDLWCFNDESVARAIYNCKLPVVSAVGHEVDVTIADLVADLRAPTPTAAAELLSPEREIILGQCQQLARRLDNIFQQKIQSRGQTIDLWFGRLKHPRDVLERQRNTLMNSSRRLTQATRQNLLPKQKSLTALVQQLRLTSPKANISSQQQRADRSVLSLAKTLRNELLNKQQSISRLSEQLDLVSPLATLARGFALAHTEQGEIVRSSSQVKQGDKVTVKLKQGALACDVLERLESDLSK